jgi:acrylyl-CoA reductase (NADPH)/3-hydroxypropionyl-CoA dehydratase/3-hydroxypropionyl-CoA synthetase
MWDNRHTGATYIVNHALPTMGLRGKDELYEAWASLGTSLSAQGQGE